MNAATARRRREYGVVRLDAVRTRSNWIGGRRGGDCESREFLEQFWGFSWSASPDDVSYQRLGLISMQAARARERLFADFDGVVDDSGASPGNIMAVYRVTLPRGGLRGKWAGRPPPPAPEDLYTGPRSDGLLSTDEISGEYSPRRRWTARLQLDDRGAARGRRDRDVAFGLHFSLLWFAGRFRAARARRATRARTR